MSRKTIQHQELDFFGDMSNNNINNDTSSEEDFKEFEDAYNELKSSDDEDSVDIAITSSQNSKEVKKMMKEKEKSENTEAAAKMETNIRLEMAPEVQTKKKKSKTLKNVHEKAKEISDSSKSTQESNEVLLSTSEAEPQKEIIDAIEKLRLELSLTSEKLAQITLKQSKFNIKVLQLLQISHNGFLQMARNNTDAIIELLNENNDLT